MCKCMGTSPGCCSSDVCNGNFVQKCCSSRYCSGGMCANPRRGLQVMLVITQLDEIRLDMASPFDRSMIETSNFWEPKNGCCLVGVSEKGSIDCEMRRGSQGFPWQKKWGTSLNRIFVTLSLSLQSSIYAAYVSQGQWTGDRSLADLQRPKIKTVKWPRLSHFWSPLSSVWVHMWHESATSLRLPWLQERGPVAKTVASVCFLSSRARLTDMPFKGQFPFSKTWRKSTVLGCFKEQSPIPGDAKLNLEFMFKQEWMLGN